MPAWAEVCDKARPLWDGGKVNQVQELFFVLATPLGLGAITLVVLAVLVRKTGLSLLVALALSLLSAIILVDWVSSDDGVADVLRSAYREGCIGAPYFTAAVFVTMAASLLIFARTKRATQ